MKDREVVESYLKSIKEELIMYSDSLSEKSLCYIDKLKKSYNGWEKDLEKLNGTWVKKNKEAEDEKDTEVDNDLYDMIDEYLGFLNYKKEYLEDGKQEKLEMSHTELSHFLTLLSDMFENIKQHSKDNTDEIAMIKSTIKSIYQNFG